MSDQQALQGVDLRLLEYAYRWQGRNRDLSRASKTLQISETYVTVAVARLEANHYLELDKTTWKLTSKGVLAAQALASIQRSRHYLWLCVLFCSAVLASVIYGLLVKPGVTNLSLLPSLAIMGVFTLYVVWMLRNHLASRSRRDTYH